MERKQAFKITGVANKIEHAPPITSTQTEKKRLLYIGLQVSGYANNEIQVYHETTLIQQIPDQMIDLEAPTLDTNLAKPGARLTLTEIGFDLPVGERMTAAIKCGATTKDLTGFYAYEVIAG